VGNILTAGYRPELTSDCEQCFGFCCRALYFKASDGFPVDKEAGVRCPNLNHEYKCMIHSQLQALKMKGCMAYECFGAGQKVAQMMKDSKSAIEMFETFHKMKQLHEMLWYLADAREAALHAPDSLKEKLQRMDERIHKLTMEKPDIIRSTDIDDLGRETDELLTSFSKWFREAIKNQDSNALRNKKALGRSLDLIGAKLTGSNLRGQNLKGAYLIAADLRNSDLTGVDLRGADMRDAELSNANLEGSLFITQNQINSARGNSKTKLPVWISRPVQWV